MARGVERTASGLTLGGLDAILAGHLAQAAPIGDDPVYKPGAYKGKGLNKPPDNYRGPEPKTLAEFVHDARLFLDEFEDVVFLRNTHRVDDVGDESWSAERRERYRSDAERFLMVAAWPTWNGSARIGCSSQRVTSALCS